MESGEIRTSHLRTIIEIIEPYCDRCRRHQIGTKEALKTQVLGLSAASWGAVGTDHLFHDFVRHAQSGSASAVRRGLYWQLFAPGAHLCGHGWTARSWIPVADGGHGPRWTRMPCPMRPRPGPARAAPPPACPATVSGSLFPVHTKRRCPDVSDRFVPVQRSAVRKPVAGPGPVPSTLGSVKRQRRSSAG